MLNYEIKKKKTTYESFCVLSETNDKLLNDRPKKMEDILIYLHSFSHRYQIIAFFVFSFFCLIFGIQEFTFIYVFLLPQFYLQSNPLQGKIIISF